MGVRKITILYPQEINDIDNAITLYSQSLTGYEHAQPILRSNNKDINIAAAKE